jgi:hypothetical protein
MAARGASLSLQPFDMVPEDDRPLAGEVLPREGRAPEFRVLHELRARTVAMDLDDPLALTDWWAVIDDGPRNRTNASRRVWRVKHELVLPRGIWSITSVAAPGEPGMFHIAARFEGYQPWWRHASERAWRRSFYRSVESHLTAEEEPDAPPIPGTEYELDPEASRHVVRRGDLRQ